MKPPKTLMQMALGKDPSPHPIQKSALVIIDAQEEYFSGKLPLPDGPAALAELSRLLTRFREAGRPVVHVRHQGKPGGLFDPEGQGFAIAEAAAPRQDECIVTKELPNAFAKTGLKSVLSDLGLEAITIAGFMTHMCVSSTARAALDHGFGCTVVAAACATRDLPDGAGGVIRAGELHRAELAALADRFAVIAASSKDL